jgi:DnaK suppressor protein
MEPERARELLDTERAEVQRLLTDMLASGADDRDAENDDDPGDSVDRAQPMVAEGVDDAVVAGLRDRLAAIERAEKRLADGTFGLSVRSGEPIPDERLEVMPTAELTVAEAGRTA